MDAVTENGIPETISEAYIIGWLDCHRYSYRYFNKTGIPQDISVLERELLESNAWVIKMLYLGKIPSLDATGIEAEESLKIHIESSNELFKIRMKWLEEQRHSDGMV